jgi:hypothetical protein
MRDDVMPTANINNSNCAVDLHLSSGGERTRTADFHVAKVDPADFGGLLRLIAAGQNVIHTLANYPAQRRPRDRRAMCDTKAHVMSGYVEGGPMVA